jgi:hypothetical protein
MYIVSIAWLYVVLMMSITEQSIVAGCLSFLFYGVLPNLIILYLSGSSHRKRKRKLAESLERNSNSADAGITAAETTEPASPASQDAVRPDSQK